MISTSSFYVSKTSVSTSNVDWSTSAIRPSSPSGLIESRRHRWVHEVDIFSHPVAANSPYVPRRRGGGIASLGGGSLRARWCGSGTSTEDANPITILALVLRLTSSDQWRGGPDRGSGWSDPRTVAECEPTMIQPWRCGSPPQIDERWQKRINSRRWQRALVGGGGPGRTKGVLVARQPATQEEVLPSPKLAAQEDHRIHERQ
jgi:hypothetical protein